MASEKTCVQISKIESIGHFDSKGARHAIYSVDVQPAQNVNIGSAIRAATGGGDCTVRIWDISKLHNIDAQDLLLACLEHHTKSVNIVRWSADGTLLASGSDDTYIIIYRLMKTGQSSSNFGSNHKKNKENWVRFFTLRGHTMDVLDLDWSPRDILVSGSIDNKILIWTDIDKQTPTAILKTPYRILEGHQSFVKGVAFDPTGRYLASCCSDNIVIIWDAIEWTSITRLESPMQYSPDRAIFRRMSWAPDGNSLCLSSASKSEKPVGMVLKRGSWEIVADLVGHDSQSNCCRFFPHVLTNGEKQTAAPICTVALGDQSGLITLWSTDKPAPYLVLRDCFDGACTDVAWTLMTTSSSMKSSRVLVISSLDGTIAFVTFTGDMIAPMTKEQLDSHFLRLYGENIDNMKQAPEALIDNPEVLRYLDAHKSRQNVRNGSTSVVHHSQQQQSSILRPAMPMINSEKSVLEQQQVTVNKAGKKRIRPVMEFTSYEADDVNTPTIMPALASSSAVNTTQTLINTGAINGEEQQQVNGVVGSCGSVVGESSVGADGGRGGEAGSNNKVPFSPLTMRTSNGIPSVTAANGFKPPSTVVGNGLFHDSVTARTTQQQTQLMPPPAPLALTSQANVLPSSSILQISYDSDKVVHSASRLSLHQTRSILVRTDNTLQSAANLPSFLQSQPLSVHAQIIAPPSLLLSQKSQSSFLTVVSLSQKNNSNIADNNSSNNNSNNHVWTNVITGEITSMAACSSSSSNSSGTISAVVSGGFCIVGCIDGSLHILSLQTGTRMFAPLILGLAVIHIDIIRIVQSNVVDVYRILATTADGEIWVWNIAKNQLKCDFRTNIKPILLSMKCRKSADTTQHASVDEPTPVLSGIRGNKDSKKNKSDVHVHLERCYLTTEGTLMAVVKSSGAVGGNVQAFAYCSLSMTWTRQADLRHVMSSAFITTSATTGRTEMEALQDTCIKEGGLSAAELLNVSRARILAPTAELKKFEGYITLAHVEERLCAAFALNRLPDAQYWLSEWVGLCCRNQGLENRLRCLVENLLCDSSEHSSEHASSALAMHGSSQLLLFFYGNTNNIMGLSKLEWLKEVIIPAIVQVRGDHALFNEIQEILRLLAR